MTVIFHTNVEMPVLAGDMLVSTLGHQRHSDLRLPSQPNGIVSPEGFVPNQVPYSLRRKTFVVNARLVVGAAGSVVHIRRFLSALLNRFGEETDLSAAEVRAFLEEYAAGSDGRRVMSEIGAILLVEADDWRGSLVGGGVTRHETMSERFGRVIAIGSGAGRILEEVEKADRYSMGLRQPPDGRSTFPEFRTLMSNLMLLANVYWQEFIAPERVFDAWGGAYDLIYQDASGVFRHLDAYTMVLRTWDAAHPDDGIQLANIFKYERRQDFSYIMMPGRDTLQFFGSRDITATDEPWRIEIRGDELNMNSQLNISIIAVHKDNRYLFPIVQIDGLDPHGSGKQTIFADFDDEGRLRVLFNSEHDDWLESQAREYYSRSAHKFT